MRQWQREYLEEFYVLLANAPPDFIARMVVATVLEVLEYWLLNPQIGDAKAMVDIIYAMLLRSTAPAR